MDIIGFPEEISRSARNDNKGELNPVQIVIVYTLPGIALVPLALKIKGQPQFYL